MIVGWSEGRGKPGTCDWPLKWGQPWGAEPLRGLTRTLSCVRTESNCRTLSWCQGIGQYGKNLTYLVSENCVRVSGAHIFLDNIYFHSVCGTALGLD